MTTLGEKIEIYVVIRIADLYPVFITYKAKISADFKDKLFQVFSYT